LIRSQEAQTFNYQIETKLMKKKQKSDQSDYRRLIRRGFLIMRLSILLILLGVLQSAASVYAQNWRFTLDEKNASIKEIMEKIESQSEFRFSTKTSWTLTTN
jgi:hypothetical protein